MLRNKLNQAIMNLLIILMMLGFVSAVALPTVPRESVGDVLVNGFYTAEMPINTTQNSDVDGLSPNRVICPYDPACLWPDNTKGCTIQPEHYCTLYAVTYGFPEYQYANLFVYDSSCKVLMGTKKAYADDFDNGNGGMGAAVNAPFFGTGAAMYFRVANGFINGFYSAYGNLMWVLEANGCGTGCGPWTNLNAVSLRPCMASNDDGTCNEQEAIIENVQGWRSAFVCNP